MEKALKLFLMYLLLLFTGIILGTLFYSFYLNIQGFVAGQQLELFSLDTLINSLFYVSVIMCFLIFPLVSYYRIRHLGGIIQNISYILIVLLTFAVILPAILQIKKTYYYEHPAGNNISHLSGGYFRTSGDKVYYFTRDFYSNPVTGEDTTTVIIDTAENGKVSIEHVKESPDFELYKDAAPYKEVLVKKTFGNYGNILTDSVSILEERAEKAFSSGLTFYLGFLSAGLAFACIYGVTRFFKWKLLNAFLIIFNSILIFLTQSFYFSPYADRLKNSIGQSRVMLFLEDYMEAPVLVCFYLILSLAFVVMGIVTDLIIKHKKKKKAA